MITEKPALGRGNQTLLLCLFLLAFLAHAAYLECVAEDSYITFRFAQNVAEGAGFVWNIGEQPVEGFTNFLWVVMCALIFKTGLPLPVASQILGFAFSIGTVLYSYSFATRVLFLRGLFAYIPVIALIIAGPFAAWSVSGMETNIFGFFLAAAIFHYCIGIQSSSKQHSTFAYFLLFLSTLTRPEGFIIFVLLSSQSLFIQLLARKPLSTTLVPALAFILPFLAYFVWRYSYFGFPLPNTFYAKTGGGISQQIRGARHAGYFYLYFIVPYLLMPALLAVFNYRFIANSAKSAFPNLSTLRSVSDLLVNHIGTASLLLVSTVYSIYIVYVGGDYMAMFRFFVPFLPFLYLLVAVLMNYLYQLTSSNANLRILQTGLLFSTVAILIQSTPLEKHLFPPMPVNHGTYRGIETERWHAARLSLIGRYFDTIKGGYQDSLATGGIGATGYFAHMKIIDLHGLVDPYLAHKEISPDHLGMGLPGHERGDLPYIFSKNPSYFMFDRELSPEPSAIPEELTRQVGNIIEREYLLEYVWLEDPHALEKGYFTYLKRIGNSSLGAISVPKS